MQRMMALCEQLGRPMPKINGPLPLVATDEQLVALITATEEELSGLWFGTEEERQAWEAKKEKKAARKAKKPRARKGS
jgi:hypothetical protein